MTSIPTLDRSTILKSIAGAGKTRNGAARIIVSFGLTELIGKTIPFSSPDAERLKRQSTPCVGLRLR